MHYFKPIVLCQGHHACCGEEQREGEITISLCLVLVYQVAAPLCVRSVHASYDSRSFSYNHNTVVVVYITVKLN